MSQGGEIGDVKIRDVGFMSKEDFAVLFVAPVFGPLGPSMAPCAQTESGLLYLHEQQPGPPQISHLMDVSTWGQLVSKTKSAVIYLKYTQKGLGKGSAGFVKREGSLGTSLG